MTQNQEITKSATCTRKNCFGKSITRDIFSRKEDGFLVVIKEKIDSIQGITQESTDEPQEEGIEIDLNGLVKKIVMFDETIKLVCSELTFVGKTIGVVIVFFTQIKYINNSNCIVVVRDKPITTGWVKDVKNSSVKTN